MFLDVMLRIILLMLAFSSYPWFDMVVYVPNTLIFESGDAPPMKTALLKMSDSSWVSVSKVALWTWW